MKKHFFKVAAGLSAAVTMGLALVSCNSVPPYSTWTNEIKAERFVIDTYLDRNDWDIIGTASGESAFVGPASGEQGRHDGDTGKYGYIYEPAEAFFGQSEDGKRVYVGTGKQLSSVTEDESLHLARLNANYALIEAAYELGGDSVFDPIYTVQTRVNEGIVSYKVTVRAKVIKINKK